MERSDRALIEKIASDFKDALEKNYEPGFGVSPSARPTENYYQQVWARDLAHAGGNYLATQQPQALEDSLKTIFAHQRGDGMLPLRVEKQYMILKIIPGLRALAKPVFNFIEGKIRGRKERPVYEGQDFSSAEDTVPVVLIAVGEFFLASPEGKRFAKEYFKQLENAVRFFETKVDPRDELAVVKYGNVDWADSIRRGGKLGSINIWWVRALYLMELMAAADGENGREKYFSDEFNKTKASTLEKLYQKNNAYFRAKEGEERIDTVACIFGSLYLLDPDECVRVQETLKNKMATRSGLKNFDPSYPKSQIMPAMRLIGHGGYHNEDIWPWVTCKNIQVKIKIATQHPDRTVRDRFQEEAISDLRDTADLFQRAGGAYEIFHPDDRTPAIKRFYTPPQNFMGSMVAYEGAYLRMKNLGWL